MSETAAAQPWWADVQHLRPRNEGVREHRTREHSPARSSRFQRVRGDAHEAPAAAAAPLAASAPLGGLATAVAVAEVKDLPRLDDIDWHAFVSGHAELAAPAEPLPAEPDVAPPAPGHDPLAALDWEISSGREARGDRRRTVEIRGQVGAAATAPVDPAVAASVAPRGRAARRPVEPGFQGRPDRVAMWAFVLGVLLMIVALFSTPEADAAVRVLAG